MRKKRFDLQIFAEDAVQASIGAAESKTAEVKEESKAKYTDEDVDKLLDRKYAEWQKKQQKAVDEAKKLAEMNAQQKAEYERDELQKQLDDYKRKDALAEMTKTARKMLTDKGVNVSDDVLAVLVTTNAEETKAAVDGFAKVFKDAVEAAVKERVKGTPPKVGSSGGASMSKDEIMQIRDPELRQRKMLENKHLFNL